MLAVDVDDFHLTLGVDSRVGEGLDQRSVRIRELDVFANESDGNLCVVRINTEITL